MEWGWDHDKAPRRRPRPPPGRAAAVAQACRGNFLGSYKRHSPQDTVDSDGVRIGTVPGSSRRIGPTARFRRGDRGDGYDDMSSSADRRAGSRAGGWRSRPPPPPRSARPRAINVPFSKAVSRSGPLERARPVRRSLSLRRWPAGARQGVRSQDLIAHAIPPGHGRRLHRSGAPSVRALVAAPGFVHGLGADVVASPAFAPRRCRKWTRSKCCRPGSNLSRQPEHRHKDDQADAFRGAGPLRGSAGCAERGRAAQPDPHHRRDAGARRCRAPGGTGQLRRRLLSA